MVPVTCTKTAPPSCLVFVSVVATEQVPIDVFLVETYGNSPSYVD